MRAILLVLFVAVLIAAPVAIGDSQKGSTDHSVAQLTSQQYQLYKTYIIRQKQHNRELKKLAAVRWLNKLADGHKRRVWQLEEVMGVHHVAPIRRPASYSITGAKLQLKRWRNVEKQVLYRYHHPPHFAELMCIHSGIKGGHWSAALKYLGGGKIVGKGEASWKNPGIWWNGGVSPYFGGLSMDRNFMKSYAPKLYFAKGTANNWDPYEQLWTAVHAVEQLGGYGSWPNTGPACDLPV